MKSGLGDYQLYINLVSLALAWAWTLTISTLLTSIGPLSAQALGMGDSFATFTIGIFLIGAALSSIPSSLLFNNFGRLGGFTIGCFCQVLGSGFGLIAMHFGLSGFLFLACLFIGLGQGLGQFYRFSAIETAPAVMKNRAVTFVLTGGIIAAFLGPFCAQETIDLINPKYFASFIVMMAFGFINQITILFVQFPSTVKPEHPEGSSELNDPASDFVSAAVAVTYLPPRRPLLQIVTQPAFYISCAVATLAHTIMVVLMGCVTLAMAQYGFSFGNTSLTLQLHFFAMFGPGFVTGSLMSTYGCFSIACSGSLLFLAAFVMLGTGVQLWNFLLGMILLGVGWNFSFSAGTLMLSDSYTKTEATLAQAVNDSVLFTVAGSFNLLSGYLLSNYGWNKLIIFTIPLIAANVLLFIIAWFVRHKKDSNPTYSPLEEHLIHPHNNSSMISSDDGKTTATQTYNEPFNYFQGHYTNEAGTGSGRDRESITDAALLRQSSLDSVKSVNAF